MAVSIVQSLLFGYRERGKENGLINVAVIGLSPVIVIVDCRPLISTIKGQEFRITSYPLEISLIS